MESLQIQNLQIKHKQNEGGELVVCDRLSFDINMGEVIGIFGPNGSGKTTLMKCILGLIKPSKGEVNYVGRDKITYAYIPQQIENSFFSWLSVRRNINYVRNVASKNTLQSLWNDFYITFDPKIKPSKCSGGMLQQAAIVRAFINNPDVIVGDEPFSALDVETAGRIRWVFRKKVKQCKAIAIVAMHNLDDLMAVCDKVIFIPNKPYSSVDDKLLHPIKIYTNKYVSKDDFFDKESSLKSTLEQVFE